MFSVAKLVFGNFSKFIFEKCLFWSSYDFLDITNRFSSKNDPQGFDFQLTTTLGGWVNIPLKVFCMTFGPKTTCIKIAIFENLSKNENSFFGGAMIFWTSPRDSPRKMTPKGLIFSYLCPWCRGKHTVKGFFHDFWPQNDLRKNYDFENFWKNNNCKFWRAMIFRTSPTFSLYYDRKCCPGLPRW